VNPALRGAVGRLARHPVLAPAARWVRRRTFPGSATYWERRYAAGGTSGTGSAGPQAAWKAEVVNGWVRELGVTSVVDLGCGDGQQLALAEYPRYLGIDPSATAVRRCMGRFAGDDTKSFLHLAPGEFTDPAGWLRADLALSMEVLFHLVEQEVFEDYLRLLFASAERWVGICSNDTAGGDRAAHERHRSFTQWVADHQPGWELRERLDPPAGVDLMSSFHLYARTSTPTPPRSTP
jgi:SAM-dependent methyltransferase